MPHRSSTGQARSSPNYGPRERLCPSVRQQRWREGCGFQLPVEGYGVISLIYIQLGEYSRTPSTHLELATHRLRASKEEALVPRCSSGDLGRELGRVARVDALFEGGVEEVSACCNEPKGQRRSRRAAEPNQQIPCTPRGRESTEACMQGYRKLRTIDPPTVHLRSRSRRR